MALTERIILAGIRKVLAGVKQEEFEDIVERMLAFRRQVVCAIERALHDNQHLTATQGMRLKEILKISDERWTGLANSGEGDSD